MDLRHQGAGGVDHAQLTLGADAVHFGGDAVSREDDRLSARNVALAVHEDRPLGGEGGHHVGVVNDLPADVDRRTELEEDPLDGLDRSLDAGAVATRGDEFQLARHAT